MQEKEPAPEKQPAVYDLEVLVHSQFGRYVFGCSCDLAWMWIRRTCTCTCMLHVARARTTCTFTCA